MPPRKTRKTIKTKPLIYIFYEGESEQCYAKFLKEQFGDVASFIIPSSKGLFSEAESKFHKDIRYRNSIEVTNEVWFFFDVEEVDRDKWDNHLRIIKKLRRLGGQHKIRVRLLMTSGCIEYWFMLHYQMISPPIITVADKERIRHQLERLVPSYKKGNQNAISGIAKSFPIAVENGQQVLQGLLSSGLPTLDDSDERNKWLYQSSLTFTTVHEAIQFLQAKSN